METGSLHKALFEQRHTNTETELHWSARFDICLGIAKDTAGRLHQQGRFLNLVDKKLGSRFDNKQALTLLHLAMECTNQSPTLRPSMSEVVTKLSDIKASVPSSSSEVV
ncbi:hypothetical protein OIU76_021628 [Salix suchowensis]|nr:hypothetical protein OIU76_021628 [Salix suchowensis]